MCVYTFLNTFKNLKTGTRPRSVGAEIGTFRARYLRRSDDDGAANHRRPKHAVRDHVAVNSSGGTAYEKIIRDKYDNIIELLLRWRQDDGVRTGARNAGAINVTRRGCARSGGACVFIQQRE